VFILLLLYIWVQPIIIIIRVLLEVLLVVFSWRSSRSVLLPFSQFYVEHDLRKNKIVVPFFC
jgi:hypothetical protein